MNDFQIRCFMTVVKHMSFSKAANELYITQPAISRHISNLERELRVLMFDRAGKNIALTEAGEHYYSFFKTVSKGMNELSDKFCRQDERVVGTVNYAAYPGWNISDILMDNTARISRKYPNLNIVQKFEGTYCINQLKAGIIDAAVQSYFALSDVPELDCVKLISIPLVILYSERHQLSGKERLSLSDFKNETFIYLPDDTMTGQVFRKLLHKAILPYEFHPETKPVLDSDTMMNIIESCCGVTLVDKLSRACYNPKFRFFELDSTTSIGLAWIRGNESPALRTFIYETVMIFEETKFV